MTSALGMTQRQSVLNEGERRGRRDVVDGCIALLEGHAADGALMVALGGPHTNAVLAGAEGGPGGYSPTVWAARGLRHVWDSRATDTIIGATTDDSWRVREMAAKVVTRHRVASAIDAVVALLHDENHRVNVAARRAVCQLD